MLYCPVGGGADPSVLLRLAGIGGAGVGLGRLLAKSDVEILELVVALQPLAIDEEGRRRSRPETSHWPISRVFTILPNSSLSARHWSNCSLEMPACRAICRSFSLASHAGHRPGLLRREHGVDHRVIAVVARAAGEHEGGGGEIVERELAQHVADLAGVDIFGLELAETLRSGTARSAGRSSRHIRRWCLARWPSR